MIRELTCIVCPIGCSLKVELEGGSVKSVTGNTCPRGAEYAKNECTNPVRTLTTTVISKDGTPVPVKTDKPIPKDKLFEAMEIVNKCAAPLTINIGDVIIKDVFGSNIVAAANKE